MSFSTPSPSSPALIAPTPPAGEPLKGGTGFTGRSPGGKSRWTGKAQKMVRLEARLVAELRVDHISGGQFRQGSRLIRWRTDKAPEDCRMDQVRMRDERAQ